MDKEEKTKYDYTDFSVLNLIINKNFENSETELEDNFMAAILNTETTSNISYLKSPPKQKFKWKQKEVAIKTMESEFKVLIWSKEEIKKENGSILETHEKSSDSFCKPSFGPKDDEPVNKLTFCNNYKIKMNSVKTSDENVKTTNISNICTFNNCNKSFRDSAALRKHMHVHGPRTFGCSKCGKAFLEKSKLVRHTLVHTGEKPFQCWFEGCDKRFSLDFNLRTHIRTHTGYKPHACHFEGCTKRFAQSTNLKSHLSTHLKQRKILK